MADASSDEYIDYEAFLSPTFSPQSFANTLILSTNNPTDTTLDLSTPLSRVLFDIQEIDTHIHNLTTKSALPILEYVKGRDEASRRILGRVEGDVGKLSGSYQRLEREVLGRYEKAERARLASLRSLEVLRIGRAVGRAVCLGRQLEMQISDCGLGVPGRAGKEDHREMVRAVHTILGFRALLEREEERRELQRVNVVKTLKSDLFGIVEERIKTKAQQIIREFSISNPSSSTSSSTSPTTTATIASARFGGDASSSTTTTTFAQTEDAKARTTSAITILYLLSPTPTPPATSTPSTPNQVPFQPSLLISSLQSFLQNALTSSLASISRALTTLPTLERTLLEVSARCQNVVALEMLLAGIVAPHHPLLLSSSSSSTAAAAAPPPPLDKSSPLDRDESDNTSDSSSSSSHNSNEPTSNLLHPLLTHLDTHSLPSYFWRSLASSLSPRVQEIIGRGGVSARTLRSNRERVAGAIRECVLRGSEGTGVGVGAGVGAGAGVQGVSWEREAAVMVGSVVGGLGR